MTTLTLGRAPDGAYRAPQIPDIPARPRVFSAQNPSRHRSNALSVDSKFLHVALDEYLRYESKSIDAGVAQW